MILCYTMYRAVKTKDMDSTEIDLGKWEVQLRKGSLSLAVLATVWDRERYGLEILRRLEQVAGFTVAEGTIYPDGWFH